MKAVHALAPVRIDLAGGTLDIWPINLSLPRPAVTVNVALDLPVRASVAPLPDGTIRLESEDLRLRETHQDLRALEAALAAGTSTLPLLAHAVMAVRPAQGFALRTLSTLPAGSGLGGSSALLGAVLGALHAALGTRPPLRDLQRLAQDVETRLLGTPTGYQDYFPPLFGGCLALTRKLGGLTVETLPVDLDALSARLRLVYTGEPHNSGITNWGVVRAYFDGEAATVAALHAIHGHATAAADALRDGDLDAALAAMLADGRARLDMAPGVGTDAIRTLDRAVRDAGALGTKICGAGGGGCVLVLLPDPSKGPAVDAAIAAGPCDPLALRLTTEGLRIEDQGEA